MKNIGGPQAGSISAAQILQRFVNKVPWAHLDIAGVAWQDGEQKPLAPSWGTGWGVRVLNRLVADHYEQSRPSLLRERSRPPQGASASETLFYHLQRTSPHDALP